MDLSRVIDMSTSEAESGSDESRSDFEDNNYMNIYKSATELKRNVLDDDDFKYHPDSLKIMQKYYQERENHRQRHKEREKDIQKWHDKIKPLLDEAEKRGEFRCEDYKSEIINTLSTNGSTIPFKKLAEGKSKEEVSRLFVTSLMLANDNAIDLGNNIREKELQLSLHEE